MRGVRARLLAVLAAGLALATACGSPEAPAEQQPIITTPQALVPTTPVRRELFVAPNGDDGADGGRATPVRTIARAASMATPGTTVRVADGTYPGSFRTTTSGTASARIAYVADHTWGAKIVARGSSGAAWVNEGEYVDIRGFDISGTEQDGLTQSASFGRLLNNRVHGFRGGNCIYTVSSDYQLHDIDVIGNVASGCGSSDQDHGIYVGHPRGTVAENISFGNAGDGIECWHNCNQLTISNNLVFANRGTGIIVGQGDDPNNGDVAADGFVVSNNIVVDNGRGGIVENGATGPGNRYLNNFVRTNRRPVGLQTGSESGTLTGDPGFVDYRPDGTGNYRLQPSSPAVDAGTRDGAYPIAFDGTPRPQGGGYDIGIYER